MTLKIMQLTAQEIIELNRRIILDSSIETDSFGVLKKGDLEFLIQRISKMNNLWDIATKLLVSLIESHIFIEGNKRTALNAVETFLSINNYSFNVLPVEIEFVYDIAEYQNKNEFKKIRQWIKQHCDKYDSKRNN